MNKSRDTIFYPYFCLNFSYKLDKFRMPYTKGIEAQVIVESQNRINTKLNKYILQSRAMIHLDISQKTKNREEMNMMHTKEII